jgi:endonuclease G, mitochondrial
MAIQNKNNHSKLLTWGIIGLLLAGILGLKYYKKSTEKGSDFYLSKVIIPPKNGNAQEHQSTSNSSGGQSGASGVTKDYFPSSNGEIVNHQFYALSYVEKYEQAEWVCYPLSKQILMKPNVPRSDWFNPDPLVSTKSVSHYDYKGSGYTRGHMAPAGDMSFDQTAMEESFYMSNMSPQLRGVNNGIWRELEEQTRDWTFQNKEVFIVSGPIFGNNPKFFKKKNIAIPEAFYKIIFDSAEPDVKAIAFIIPHEVSARPLSDYAVSIDKVEEVTGINFFERYRSSSMERIESAFDINKWPISNARYRLRVERWNNE